MEATQPQPAVKQSSLKWWILATVIIGTFLGRMDQTIVNLALPKIIENFNISVNSAGWIATAYILANAIFVPIWGKLGDTIGRKRVYITGFVIFIFGSVLAGLSWNLGSMIIFRIIQAIAGSADYPTAMAILAVTFTEQKERAQALGIWSASFAAAAVFGPLIGGPLIDNFGWRSVFIVNLPIGIVGLVMALAFVEESMSTIKTVKFDWWGAITLGGALSSLVLVLDQGETWGWLSQNSNLCYLALVIFSIIFYFVEYNHDEPIIDFKFFKNAVFNYTLLNNFISFMGLMGSIFLVPIFAETFLGYDATQTGYLFIPMAFALMLGAPIGGRLIGKVRSSYVIAASTLVAGLGLYFFSWLDPRSDVWAIIMPLSIMAFGLGFGMAQRTAAIASAVPTEEIGIASSILALVRNIAGAFGISVFSTILNNITNSNVLEIARSAVINVQSQLNYETAVQLIILKAQVSAYATVYLISAGVMFLGAATALLIRTDDTKLQGVEIMVE